MKRVVRARMVAAVGLASSTGEVERLLATAASDPAARTVFFRELFASDVFVLGRPDHEPSGGQFPAGTNTGIVTVRDADGPLVPFFTSEAKLRATLTALPETNPQYFKLDCRALFERTRGDRLVLNPHGPQSVKWSASDVAAYFDRRGTEAVEVPGQFVVGAARSVRSKEPVGNAVGAGWCAALAIATLAMGWVLVSAWWLIVAASFLRRAVLMGFGSRRWPELGRRRVRERLKKIARPLLQPGETVEVVVPATKLVRRPVGCLFPPLGVAAGVAIVVLVPNDVVRLGLFAAVIAVLMLFERRWSRVIVVTGRRIVVLAPGSAPFTSRTIRRELPRSTPIGPTNSGAALITDSLGERFLVYPRWAPEIDHVDTAGRGRDPR